MTYAGRLDPMASGVLLVLAGEECKNKEKYLKLSKEYDFKILFGFATDTYDILGKIVSTGGAMEEKEITKAIKNNLGYFKGKFTQKYPPYSSKTWEATRAELPVKAEKRRVNVYSLRFTKINSINSKKLLTQIKKRINKVHGPARNAKSKAFAGGDFRQKEILKLWDKYLHTSMLKYFFIASFKIRCSSGTYVRGIANSLGQRIKIPALAYSINRTLVGKWGYVR